MPSLSTTLNTHRKKFQIALGLIALYAIVGFLLVPWVAERQLVLISKERLQLDTKIDSLYLNPFSFYIEVKGLSIANENGELLSLDTVYTNFQASRLLLLKYQVADFVLDGLTLNGVRYSDGSDTFTKLAEQWSETATTETTAAQEFEEPSELPAVEVLQASLTALNFNIRDEVPITDFETSIRVNSIDLEHISTLENQSGRFSMSAAFESNSTLDVGGDVIVHPLRVDGSVNLSRFPLAMLSRYVQDNVPVSVNEGIVSSQLSFNVTDNRSSSSPATPEINLSSVNAQVENVSVTENGVEPAILGFTAFTVENGTLNIPGNSLDIDTASINGLEIRTQIDENGVLNFNRIIAGISSSSSDNETTQQSAPPSDSETPWIISLAQFNINEALFPIDDASLEIPFSTAASLTVAVSEISNEDNVSMPFNAQLSFDSGGEITTNGQLQALPSLDLETTVALDAVELAVAQPYINEFASVELQQATLNGSATVSSSDVETLGLRGDVAINNLLLSDSTLNETLFSFSELGIDVFDISLAENRADISELSMESLFSRIVINEDGSTNIGRSIKTRESEPDTEVESTNSSQDQSEPMAITLGRVSINNASANFTDRDLPIVFNANIKELNGSAEGFASNSSQATSINLEGQVDEYGLVQVTSSLSPFALLENSEFDVNFTNIDMPAMTPYVIKFAGREISEGAVDLGLSYKFLEGNLEANNQMVLKDLSLGERVEHPDAMSLPLDLALALLKDGNGVIDLEVPISGDVNDPEFDFGPAIRRAITNILTNVVAAPFRLLGGLIGGGDASLESIRFLPGRSDIAAPEQQILDQLKQALLQRPQLALEVPPVIVAEDTLALQTQELELAIETELEKSAESEELLTERLRQALEFLFLVDNDPVSLEEIRRVNSIMPESIQDAETTIDPVLDVIAYNADLRERLINATEISQTQLDQLASARALAVTEFVLSDGSISAERVKAVEPTQSVLDEDGWLMMKFGLGAL